MSTLAGRHALVTGGGTGIGAAIATTLAQAGAAVTICGRRLEPLQATAAGEREHPRRDRRRHLRKVDVEALRAG